MRHTRGISRGGTRCIFVLEHMASQLHPHGTCAPIRVEKLNPHASGRNIYLVCVSERVRNKSQEVSVCLNNR